MKWLSLIWLVVIAGCGSNPPASSPTGSGTGTNSAAAKPTNEVEEVVYHLDHAQTGLPTIKLFVGPLEVPTEVCTTVTQVSTGLMFRKGITNDETMLFVFGEPRERSFYMKNVDFDIAVAYIDAEGVIQEIVQLKARDSTGVPSKSDGIQFVLEASPDFYSRHGFGTGTLVACERGPLKQALSRFAQVR